MANQTFKVIGITVHGDTTKIRFTDDMIRRIKQFTKGGATRADFIELPDEMTKLEALKYMATHPDFQSPEDQATISDTISDKEKDTNKSTVKVKKTKPNLDDIKKRVKKSKEVKPVTEADSGSQGDSVTLSTEEALF